MQTNSVEVPIILQGDWSWLSRSTLTLTTHRSYDFQIWTENSFQSNFHYTWFVHQSKYKPQERTQNSQEILVHSLNPLYI